MKKIIIALVLIYSSVSFSQIKVTGKVVNYENIPIDLAEVLLINEDSIAQKSELTNSKGEFVLTITKGNYLLQIRQFGKKLYNSKIDLTQELDLGNIKISQRNEVLAEVIINSKKKLIERKVDRLVFNVENSIAASGGDAIDALRLTPGIRVQNDAISMIGKSGMGVMVDDKLIQLSGEDLVNFLKTIRKENIKNIEVITTPPSKYEAEGNSGLINIILKKAKKNSWSSSINTSYKQATYPTGIVGGSFNYQKEKLSINSNLNYSKGNYSGIEGNKIFYPTQVWDSRNKGKYDTNLLSSRLGIDYQIKKKWSMGIQYINSTNRPKINENNNTTIVGHNNSYLGNIITKGDQLISKDLNSLNLHSLINLDTIGTKMNIDFDYLNYLNGNERNFNTNTSLSSTPSIENGFYAANNNSNTKIENYAAKIDIEQPAKWANFSYGGKISYSNSVNALNFYDTTNGIPVLDPLQSNEFVYKENTQSLYISVNKKLGKKWNTQLGVRMESTQTNGFSITMNQLNKNSYTKLFPTFYVTYLANDNNTLSLTYNKRIRRPGFSELNPFRWYFNNYSYSEGNPNLQPNYSHNIGLDYSYKDNLFTSLSFTAGIDNSSQVTLLNPQTYEQIIQRLNYFNDYSIRLNQVHVYNKLKWFESQNSFNIYYVKAHSRIYPITFKNTDGFGASFNSSNSFILDKKSNYMAGLYFQYNFPSQTSSFQKNHSTNSLDLFIQSNFYEKKLQITVAAENLLKSDNFNNTGYSNNIQLNYRGYYDSRYIGCMITYKFGNNNIKGKKRTNINEEEKGRIN
jgi:hypothetical protein